MSHQRSGTPRETQDGRGQDTPAALSLTKFLLAPPDDTALLVDPEQEAAEAQRRVWERAATKGDPPLVRAERRLDPLIPVVKVHEHPAREAGRAGVRGDRRTRPPAALPVTVIRYRRPRASRVAPRAPGPPGSPHDEPGPRRSAGSAAGGRRLHPDALRGTVRQGPARRDRARTSGLPVPKRLEASPGLATRPRSPASGGPLHDSGRTWRPLVSCPVGPGPGRRPGARPSRTDRRRTSSWQCRRAAHRSPRARAAGGRVGAGVPGLHRRSHGHLATGGKRGS